jgi:Spy/CpxP family protein refolding chaperone
MFPKYGRAATLLVALSLSAVSIPAVSADEVPEWPSEQENQLNRADTELLEVQRARFRAIFSQDEEAVKRLDRQFKELQKDRNELLQATQRR